MKRLSLYLFLVLFTLQAPSWADDIRDFQIEGMSIGDSLLDHFSLSEITSKINSYEDKGYIYNSRDFYSLTFKNYPKFKIYDAVQVQLKDNDKEYKIYTIGGIKYYISNIKDCYEKMRIIEKEFDVLFSDTNKKRYTKRKHVYDKTGKSTTTDAFYNFSNDDYASIQCFDWSKDINISDQLNVTLTSYEFGFFLANQAYD